MKYIQLTKNQQAIVDDEVYEKVNAFKWYAVKRKYTFYAERSIHISKQKHINLSMHRYLLNLTQRDNKVKVDHIDENGLNNQSSNLRICTHAQNKRNVTKRNKDTLSKFKGVTQRKRDKMWMAQIRVNYKNIFLGDYTNEILAAQAYNNAAKKYHGEFANLNKID